MTELSNISSFVYGVAMSIAGVILEAFLPIPFFSLIVVCLVWWFKIKGQGSTVHYFVGYFFIAIIVVLLVVFGVSIGIGTWLGGV